MEKQEEKMENQITISKRKWWFKCLKKIMKIRYKKPEFIYLGNSGKPVRFWGTYQMNSGLIKMYKYQSRVYFHEKKHWSLFGARMFCLIASPLTNMFYKGLNLISTYPDGRFKNTIKESLEAIKNGENVVIFPEKSDNGYQATLDGFYGGFVFFAEICKKQGIDLPIYASYYNKASKTYLIDEPIMYSTLTKNGESREEVAKKLCDRCNELGEMTYKMMEEKTQKETEENK